MLIERAVTPQETMARVRPMLDRFGITRVADVTRLDEVGLPTHVAYRPCGRTMAVSIGIGLRPEQSWVSAVMESIEIWHAENPCPPIAERARAGELNLPYPLDALALSERSPLTPETPVEWVLGRGLLSGRTIPVPLGLIRLDSTRRYSWDQVFFAPSSDGMAIGNTLPEATAHGLYEVIERDCCGRFLELPEAERRYADPDSPSHPVMAAFDALRRADCAVELCETTNDLGIPAYACAIWSADVPIFFTGFGCHLEPARAAARAMSEAALSRMAGVSGARDDIDELFYTQADPDARPDPTERELRAIGTPTVTAGTLEEMVRIGAERVRSRTGVEPVVVDMTHPDIGLPVVKVIAPGLRTISERALGSRPGGPDGE